MKKVFYDRDNFNRYNILKCLCCFEAFRSKDDASKLEVFNHNILYNILLR